MALTGWCRLHNTNQHSESDCQEFQTAASIFQQKVQHANNSSSGMEIVPSNPYDISVMVVNHVPFPRSEENEEE